MGLSGDVAVVAFTWRFVGCFIVRCGLRFFVAVALFAILCSFLLLQPARQS